MCIRRKVKITPPGQDIILGQFVYSINSSHTTNKEGIEELSIELRKMKVTTINSVLSENDTLRTDYGCNSIVGGDESYTLFADDQLGVSKFTNIDDAIKRASEVIGQTCFGKEVEDEE